MIHEGPKVRAQSGETVELTHTEMSAVLGSRNNQDLNSPSIP